MGTFGRPREAMGINLRTGGEMNNERSLRDPRGRWRQGESGNRAGRPKGSRNRWRRADLARAHAWTPWEWKLHFARAAQTAQGDPGERAAAAYAECQGLWRVLNRPKAQPGLCPQCRRPLDLPNPAINAAPLPFDNVFVHACCINQFALLRWHQAKEALSGFGIRV
jgi:hypothetical protein